MDACNAVERELDKLLGRFSTFKDSLDRLDELIQHIQTTKNGLQEGNAIDYRAISCRC